MHKPLEEINQQTYELLLAPYAVKNSEILKKFHVKQFNGRIFFQIYGTWTYIILTLTQFGVVNLFLRRTDILWVLIFIYWTKQ